MKKIYFICIIILCSIISEAQTNLVKNGSFEEYYSCPTYLAQLNNAKYWKTPTTNTPDYLNVCSSSQTVSIPFNIGGYQLPHSGNAYAALEFFYVGLNQREYIQGELLTNLTTGTKYKVGFYLSLSDSSKYAISNIGVYFSSNTFFYNYDHALNVIPQIENDTNNYFTDRINWMYFEKSYIATGNERYITIGNFHDDINTNTLNLGDYPMLETYYYIDDVFIGLDTTVDVTESVTFNKHIKVYPNPANDVIHVDYTILDDASFEIYDILGKLLHKETLDKKASFKEILLNQFTQGLYYYKIVTKNNTVINSDKLIIIK